MHDFSFWLFLLCCVFSPVFIRISFVISQILNLFSALRVHTTVHFFSFSSVFLPAEYNPWHNHNNNHNNSHRAQRALRVTTQTQHIHFVHSLCIFPELFFVSCYFFVSCSRFSSAPPIFSLVRLPFSLARLLCISSVTVEHAICMKATL